MVDRGRRPRRDRSRCCCVAFNIDDLPLLGGADAHGRVLARRAGSRPATRCGSPASRSARSRPSTWTATTCGSTSGSSGDAELGAETGASIRIKTILGAEVPGARAGRRGRARAERDPARRAPSPAYDVVEAFSDLATTTDEIDTEQLADVAGHDRRPRSATRRTRSGPPSTGSAGCPAPIASRDDQLRELLDHANGVTGVLAERDEEFVALLADGDLLLQELQRAPRRHPHAAGQHRDAGRAAHRPGPRQPAGRSGRRWRTSSNVLATLQGQPGQPRPQHRAARRRSSGSSPTPSATAAGSTPTSRTWSPVPGGAGSPRSEPPLPSRRRSRPSAARRRRRRPLRRRRCWPRRRHRARSAPTSPRGRPLRGLRRAHPRRPGRRGHRGHAGGRPGAASSWSTTPSTRCPADAKAVVVAPSVVSDRYVQLHAGLRERARRCRTARPSPWSAPPCRRAGPDLRQPRRPQRGARPGGRQQGRRAVPAARGRRRQPRRPGREPQPDARPTSRRPSARCPTAGTTCSARCATCRSSPPRWPTSDEQVRAFNTDLANVADQLAGERDDLAAALKHLAIALGEVASFVQGQPGRPHDRRQGPRRHHRRAGQAEGRAGRDPRRRPGRAVQPAATPTTRPPARSTPATTPSSPTTRRCTCARSSRRSASRSGLRPDRRRPEEEDQLPGARPAARRRRRRRSAARTSPSAASSGATAMTAGAGLLARRAAAALAAAPAR